MTFEEKKEVAIDYTETYLRSRGINPRKSFCCLNPSHSDSSPSMVFYRNTKKCHCFACNATYDIFNLVANDYGISLKEAYKKAFEIANVGEDYSPIARTKSTKTKPILEPQMAPVDMLDKTYRTFLDFLPLSEKHRLSLKLRGFTDEFIDKGMYKTFPTCENVDFKKLCSNLQRLGCVLEGVPGFYRDNGSWSFVSITQGIITPCVNKDGKIIGLHIRKDNELLTVNENGKPENKCSWFSSRDRYKGVAAKTHIHYCSPIDSDTVILTEGIMKGDLIHDAIKKPVICNEGVQQLKDLIAELPYLKSIGVKTFIIGFDMDYKTNLNVQRALSETHEVLRENGFDIKELDWNMDLVVNGVVYKLKGLDDYLVFKKYHILP